MNKKKFLPGILRFNFLVFLDIILSQIPIIGFIFAIWFWIKGNKMAEEIVLIQNKDIDREYNHFPYLFFKVSKFIMGLSIVIGAVVTTITIGLLMNYI